MAIFYLNAWMNPAVTNPVQLSGKTEIAQESKSQSSLFILRQAKITLYID
jgi:hypothetical protein